MLIFPHCESISRNFLSHSRIIRRTSRTTSSKGRFLSRTMTSHCKPANQNNQLFVYNLNKNNPFYRNSSAISEHRLCRSICEFFREFQQNSKTATIIATNRPPNRTTKTPPIFLTLKGLAFESLLLSCMKKLRKFTGVSKSKY